MKRHLFKNKQILTEELKSHRITMVTWKVWGDTMHLTLSFITFVIIHL